ncbi:BTB/POZ domain-containing protein At3g05675-like [Humulus lupulus]|uniref:BTB/POZ domain-containing protein At3g05675-like n=1 Tax=Humulus lupulus TaxID=3486 RepID=UPI002B416E21|nr:BTB/POZ domain-containing protein At3g05675-like [Humulus lupulus]XP_062074660.1 BTB/POZ domain-containing protein At3g05675-like [Humulus lupulus]XP_062074661.1 BTB/POZ domain-containing protein At3g05675-like [Humulus lupulus]
MDKAAIAKPFKLGELGRNDIVICLKNKEGRPEWFYCHSSILTDRSKYFAHQFSCPNAGNLIELQCSKFNYDHHVKLLRLLHLPAHLILDSLSSVTSAIGVLELAVSFQCEEIIQCCIQYLEAVPWEDKEEEHILKSVLKLGPVAMPVLARIQPVDLTATKNVFVSAVRFAMSINGPCPPFGEELKTSAQEQVEYMLGEDEDLPLVTADDEVRSVVIEGLCKLCKSFEDELASLLLDPNLVSDTAEAKLLHCLSDLEWMCNILPKMDLMKDFVSNWTEISSNVLGLVQDQKLDFLMWGLKIKLIEVTAKVLDAVGYGNVILPAPYRVTLLKTWLPYIRKIKPLLDSKGNEEIGFPYKMDEDLCQSIEGAIVSLILSLPSNDQADIFADWMKADQVRYPDLSEAFEVWCFRTKSAKRRLEGLNKVGNATISL